MLTLSDFQVIMKWLNKLHQHTMIHLPPFKRMSYRQVVDIRRDFNKILPRKTRWV